MVTQAETARETLARLMPGTWLATRLQAADPILKALHLTDAAALALMEDEAEYEVHQNGMPVAFAGGPHEQAFREAMHYAAVYGQDGPVQVVRVIPITKDNSND
jgi:hypothetical protein